MSDMNYGKRVGRLRVVKPKKKWLQEFVDLFKGAPRAKVIKK